MDKALVIGYGNPLRCDDGLGWQAADRLSQILPRASTHTIACHQLSPELAEAVSRARLVIFIDARLDDLPGKLLVKRLNPDLAPPESIAHSLTPAALLAWAERFYGRCPEAILLSVSGESFGHGQGLSQVVLEAMPGLIERVQELVRQEQLKCA